MELLLHSIQLDWPVLLPILVCSILVVGVVINRFSYYKKNKREVVQFIPRLQKELAKNNLDGAQNLAIQCGGVIGEVTEINDKPAKSKLGSKSATELIGLALSPVFKNT